MKILLATMSIEDIYRFEENHNAAYSLGLGYIHSYLESQGHHVKTLFLNNENQANAETKLLEEVENFSPEMIGFQVFSMVRTSTFSIIEKIYNKKIKIILGGIHPTIMYEQILEKYPYIVISLGEGEFTLAELADRFERNMDIDDVQGIAYVNSTLEIVKTVPRPLLKDLDVLPFPKHETYFDASPERTVAHVISSRGCPFRCTFCALKVISEGKVRKRSIKNVIDEIVHLKTKYPRLKHIQFHDDTMLLDNARMIDFCKNIVELDLNITFECSARVKPVSEELFMWMQKAGFKKIMFGLETGSPRILKSIKKSITREDVLNLFRILKKFDFDVTTFLICGFPGETDETIQETIDLVNETQKLKYNLIGGVGKLWVYPGTEIYEKAKQAGMMSDDFWMTDSYVPYYTVEHSYEKLCEFEEKIMNHVAIARIVTWQGFKNHFMKMPFTILFFLLKHRRKIVNKIVNMIESKLRVNK